ncbi:GntP family permease [Endozoicomonas lisbonensis]
MFVLIFLTIRWRTPAFIALLLACYVAGFGFGMAPGSILLLVTTGFGDTLGAIGLTIALGAFLGVVLEHCGATTIIANGIILLFKDRFPGLVLAVTGYIVSIPIYCESGFIILDSVRKQLARSHKVSPVFLSTVLGCSLYASHTLVPPTPGPLAAITNLNLNDHISRVMPLSLLFSMVAVFAGYAWSMRFCNTPVSMAVNEKESSVAASPSFSYPFFLAILPIVIPIVLITLGGIAAGFPELSWLTFTGHPVNALLAGLICCWPLQRAAGLQPDWNLAVKKALETGGRILLVVGSGGAFGYVLRHGGMSEFISGLPDLGHLGLLLPFLMAALIKTAEGSATVAMITSSAMVMPLLTTLGLESNEGRILAFLACGAGAMTVAHVNDSFLWVISEFTGMDTATALKSVTVATFFQGISVLIALEFFALWIL